MGKINVLKPQVAALIAAGEVVERPSSVIKELIENSIDANSQSITVEIKNGGVKYMRVTDNGTGISLEDVPAVFMRHATSKISAEEDLERIETLGFRGEAVHSIAAVSHMDIITKRQEDSDGTHAASSGGEILDISPTGCPVGTTVTVKNLFFNTPARMKFLKKDATESGYVEDVVKKVALSRPDISFRFINNGKEVFFTPGDNVLRNAVHAVYGREISILMIDALYESEGIRVWGMVGKSELVRPNRNLQIFYVNGRCVINKNFYFALSEAYKNQIMSGRFPVAVLNIEMNPALCDVNVHPSKAEIKFANDKPVYEGVYWAAKNAIYKITDTREFRIPAKKPVLSEFVPTEKPKQTELPFVKLIPVTEPEKTVQTQKYQRPEAEARPFIHTEPELNEKPYMPEPPKPVYKEPEVIPEIRREISVRVIGQVFDTYIVAEKEEGMLLVDQHAAHERLIYNDLLKSIENSTVDSQMLLLPATVNLTAAEFAVFEEKKELLRLIGFEAEDFGANTVKISMVPTALAGLDIESAFVEIIDNLSSSRHDIKTTEQENALYTIACKAAMKAGKTLSVPEQEVLVKKILELEGEPTCPHGRPVILSLTKKQIEKQFKRIV